MDSASSDSKSLPGWMMREKLAACSSMLSFFLLLHVTLFEGKLQQLNFATKKLYSHATESNPNSASCAVLEDACFGSGILVAHTFSKSFSASKMSIKSVKMKVETRSRILWRPHEFVCAGYNFGLLSPSLICFIVWKHKKRKAVSTTNHADCHSPKPFCRTAETF